MTQLEQLIKQLQDINSEIGAHPSIDGRVSFFLNDEEISLKSIEPWVLIGCGCTAGAFINFIKKEELK